MSVADRLAAEIRIQQGEVDRLTTALKIDLPAAQAKLDALKALAAEVTPEFELFTDRLAKVQIHTVVNQEADAVVLGVVKEK